MNRSPTKNRRTGHWNMPSSLGALTCWPRLDAGRFGLKIWFPRRVPTPVSTFYRKAMQCGIASPLEFMTERPTASAAFSFSLATAQAIRIEGGVETQEGWGAGAGLCVG